MAIKVQGFSSCTTKDALQCYFENTRRSKGGSVRNVNVTGETAVVSFSDSGGKYVDISRITSSEKKKLHFERENYMLIVFVVLVYSGFSSCKR